MKIVLFIIICFTTIKSRAGEKDLYDFKWLDPDKSVYVLQNKIYPKNKTYYLDIGYLTGLSSDFQDTSGMQIRTGYYFKEEWAFEMAYAQYGHQDNSAYDSIKVINGADPFIRRFTKTTSALLIWSPFYGKINTFNKIYYFDWSFGLGVSQATAESNIDSVRNPASPNIFKRENFNPLLLKTNLKFHLNENIHLGVEFLNSNYEANTPKSPNHYEWKQNNDLIISIGVSF